MKKIESVIINVVFALLLVIPLVLTLVSPKKTFSEWENRDLKSISEVSEKSVFSGEFGAEFEVWLTDHFFARDFWVKFKRSSDSALMIRESNGVAVGDNCLFDIPDKIVKKAVDKNISAINTFARDRGIPTSVILVPSSGGVFPENTPSLFPNTGELQTIEDIYSRLDGVTTVDAAASLKTLSYSEAFFKTDHHWTSRGAASVYSAWKGKDYSFEYEVLSDSFYGTLTSRSGEFSVSPDTFERIKSGDRFTSCSVFNGREWTDYSSMYFDEYLDKKDKYSYFLGTNEPVVVIDTGAEGKTLLVFKDSFSHSFAQCLSEDYARVILVDLRYVTAPVNTLVDMASVDEALFLYSLETFTTLDNMLWIK